MKTASYKDLIVWQKAMDLVVLIHYLTKDFPKEEWYGLRSQMRRSVQSIPTNISEGSKRKTTKDYCSFVYIASGSGAELETQIEIAKRLKYISPDECMKADNLLSEIMKMLTSLIHSLQEKQKK